jgi:hypothetical protein
LRIALAKSAPQAAVKAFECTIGTLANAAIATKIIASTLQIGRRLTSGAPR